MQRAGVTVTVTGRSHGKLLSCERKTGGRGMFTTLRPTIVASAVLLATAVGGMAQEEKEEKKLGWSNVADLGLVITSGNAPKTTFTFDDKLIYAWERSNFTFKAGALRTNDADDAFAVGTEDDFDIVYPELKLDNERFYVNGRYDRQINERFYWVAGAGWQRDTDAGIENRVDAFVGAGNYWKNTENLQFKTDYTFGLTTREDEIEDPLREKRYPSARLSYDLMTKISKHAQFDSDLVFVANLKTAEDWNINNINAVTSNLTDVLALRASLQFIYYHLPALDEFDLFDIDPSEGDAEQTGTVITRKKALDTVVKVTLVVTF
jgi:putative salt-induced outer membrane protein YdiY